MTYNPDQHHRRSIRLKGYDYSQTGAYFVTICTHERECLFGTVDDGIRLNNCGQIIAETWQGLILQYDQIELDEWLVMPNHLHGIVVINNPVGARFIAPFDRSGHVGMVGHSRRVAPMP